MRLNIESADWGIWALIILPIFLIAGFIFGFEKAIFLVFLLPFLVFLKDDFLEKKLTWKPEYSVGVEDFDIDHQKLLDMMLKLFKSLRKVRGKEDASKVLQELRDYTEYHFDREEKMMEEQNYPELEEHRKEHEGMKSKMADFQAQFDLHSSKVSRDVLNYLQNWLINHINVTDKKYTEYFNNRGIN